MSSVVYSVIVFLFVAAGLFVIEMYLARRRDQRILSRTDDSMLKVQGHSDARMDEARKRSELYQDRIVRLMEEHNALLQEIRNALQSRELRPHDAAGT